MHAGTTNSTALTRPPAEPVRLLLRPRGAAEALAISQRLLWELTKRGEIPCLRLPGRGSARSIRYDVRDLLAWIDRVKAEQAAGAVCVVG